MTNDTNRQDHLGNLCGYFWVNYHAAVPFRTAPIEVLRGLLILLDDGILPQLDYRRSYPYKMAREILRASVARSLRTNASPRYEVA